MDYYALLGVPRSAGAAEVRDAYKLQQRIWRKRAAAQSDASASGEATRRLAQLDEALAVLSDQQRRAAYDRLPAPAPSTGANPITPADMPSGNLIEQAEAYLEIGDYYSAAHAAREATRIMGTSAESWFALSRASAGLGHREDAVYEARRAIELAPGNPQCHFNLGMILEEASNWDSALSEYEQAAQLNPAEPMYQLAIGGIWLQREQPDQALPTIERVYSSAPNDEAACYYYAQALIAAAEAVPHDKSEDGYAVASALEIQRMRDYLSRAAAIRHLDPETRQNLHDTETYLQRMEGHTLHVPFGAISTFSAIGGLVDGADGCGAEAFMLVLATVLIGLIAFAPLWLLIWGGNVLFAGNPGGLLILVAAGGLGYLWYRSIWVPRWKVNARKRDHRIRYQS